MIGAGRYGGMLSLTAGRRWQPTTGMSTGTRTRRPLRSIRRGRTGASSSSSSSRCATRRRPCGSSTSAAGRGSSRATCCACAADAEILGVDLSAAGVQMAQRKVPGARFFQQDFTQPIALARSLQGVGDARRLLRGARAPRRPRRRCFATFARSSRPAAASSSRCRRAPCRLRPAHRPSPPLQPALLETTLRGAGLEGRRPARRGLSVLQPVPARGRRSRQEGHHRRRRGTTAPAAAGARARRCARSRGSSR